MTTGPLRIRTLTYGGMGAVGLLTVVGAISVYFITHRVRRAAEALTDNLADIEAADQLEASVLLASRAASLSVVLRDGAYAAERDLAIKSAHGGLDELEAGRQEPAEAAHIAEVQQLLRAWEASARAMAGAPTLTDPRAARFRRSTDAVLGAARSLVEFEDQQAAETQQRVLRWHQRAIAVAIGLTAAYVLIAGIYLALLRGMIFGPIEALDERVDRFSRSDGKERLSPGGVRELRHLVETFDRMAEAIRRQRQQQLSFLVAVAHDLRNPLAALRIAAGTFSPERPLPAEVALRKTLALLSRQVASLDRLTGDLLDAARIESGAFGLQLQPWDLREAVAEAADLYRDVSNVHELQVSVPDKAVLARCDPGRVEQILNNLVSNAIKYSPVGGSVRIELRQLEMMAELSVSDRGIGIAPEELDRIFEPFHRGAAVQSAIPGVGIGLSVVRKLVAAHGGEIRVESRPGEGSTFRVLLPLERASGRDLAAPAAPAPPR